MSILKAMKALNPFKAARDRREIGRAAEALADIARQVGDLLEQNSRLRDHNRGLCESVNNCRAENRRLRREIAELRSKVSS